MQSDAQAKFDSGVIFLDQSQFFAHIATNGIASFFNDNRLRQIAFFVLAKEGKGWLLTGVERFWNN